MLGKSRIAVFFHCFVVLDVRKVGSLKWRARRSLFRRDMKNGTPLWREAHFEVKMYKTPHGVASFLEVQTPKNSTPSWREAHL